MHHHENEQVCVVLEGEMVVHTEDDSVTLGEYDSVWLASDEPTASRTRATNARSVSTYSRRPRLRLLDRPRRVVPLTATGRSTTTNDLCQ